jgi:AcrR family transcriptional regulator
MVRGEPREAAILKATGALLAELGYEALTIDAVAARAGSSKATIYRRWRNKAQLVKAVLDALDAEHNAEVPDTGALRSDLVAVLRASRDRATAPYVAMMQDLVMAARRDAGLAKELRAHTDTEALSPFQHVLERAVARRRLSASAPMALVHEVAEAMLLRQIQLGHPLDEAFIARVVDELLLPLLRRKGAR